MERAAVVVGAAEARPLIDYTEHKTDRTGTGEAEFDRVLGGGLVPGALVLLGGEPGIGKSTLSLQTAMKAKGKVLYVSGEESPEQVRLRADRLGTLGPELLILPETSTEGIVRAIKDHRPDLLFVDSIQTLHTPRVESAPRLRRAGKGIDSRAHLGRKAPSASRCSHWSHHQGRGHRGSESA